jgi:hypothetical protein
MLDHVNSGYVMLGDRLSQISQVRYVYLRFC